MFLSKKTVCYIAFVLLIVDLITKQWTHLYLPLMAHSPSVYPYGGVGVFENFFGVEFSLSYMRNTGAAWGMFHQFTGALLVIRLVMVAALLIYFFRYLDYPPHFLPLMLITSGALGNIIDMALYGYVIDMFNFVLWGYDYPVFNVADALICLGVVMLTVSSLRDRHV